MNDIIDHTLDDAPDWFSAIEEIIGYQFSDRGVLRHAMTHASVAPTRLESNERLEFLGDAIMGAVVCEMLFERFPEELEGELTRIKSAVVSRNTCAAITDELGLDQYLLLGKGLSGPEELPLSIRAAIVEALVAAIYIDGGFDAARKFVSEVMEVHIDRTVEHIDHRNYKSILQQMSQRRFGTVPEYRMLDEQGPDHSKCFKVSVVIGPRHYPAAWGGSKKQAEQRAAKNALHNFDDRVTANPEG